MSTLLCCCETCDEVIKVRGCPVYGVPVVIPGATVSYTQGSFTSPTGTTDAGGNVTVHVHNTGPAVFTVVPPAGSHYDTFTGTLTLACPNSGLTVNLTPSAGYSCSDDGCCPTGGDPPYPTHSYPATLFLNDGFGMVTLTQSSGMNWSGGATRTAANGYLNVSGTCTPSTGISVPVQFTLVCGTSGWSLTVLGGSCSAGSSGALIPGVDNGATVSYLQAPGVGSGAAASSCPPAFSVTITKTIGSTFAAFQIWGGSFSATVTQ